MEDTAAKQELLQERQFLARNYEEVVLEWIASAETSRPTSAPAPVTPPPSAVEIRKRRDELAEKLRKNYWQLDPYVRARSVYDRTGELKTGSTVESAPTTTAKGFTPKKLAPPAGETTGRPSVDSVAQSFYTTRETFDDDVD